jgi:hypothetical protein
MTTKLSKLTLPWYFGNNSITELHQNKTITDWFSNELTNYTEQSPSWEANISSAVKTSHNFKGPENSLSYSQKSADCPYPESRQSIPCPPYHPLIHFITILPWSWSGFLPSRFPTKTLNASLLYPTRNICPDHPILLDLITRIIFSYE